VKERRYDIDWLRVIAMLAVFIYHCARFFGTEGWHLKNAEQSDVVVALRVGLIWAWAMELFFVLSGVGAWYALRSRTGGRYLWDRVKRLLIPLYTVGLLILLPPQVYFEAVTNKGYSGTFWEYLPSYYSSLPADIFGVAPRELQSPGFLVPFGFPGHLWFLQYLFLISVVALPLLLYLKTESGQRWIERLAGWSQRPGGIFLFVIPLALVLICLRFLFRGGRTWADFLWYAIFFLIGYIMAADNRLTESIKRHGWVCLVLWIVGFSGVGLIAGVLGYDLYPGREPFSLVYVLVQIIWSITSWSAVVFMLSLGAKYLNHRNKVLAYGNEAVLPFYLLHQTVILCVGWFVIRWGMGILPKYLIIAAVSFVLIVALYQLLVRPFNMVRFLFGMRPKRRPAE
jgi:peptidoglycan/LPS O-acetylase OafA/YrhL